MEIRKEQYRRCSPTLKRLVDRKSVMLGVRLSSVYRRDRHHVHQFFQLLAHHLSPCAICSSSTYSGWRRALRHVMWTIVWPMERNLVGRFPGVSRQEPNDLIWLSASSRRGPHRRVTPPPTSQRCRVSAQIAKSSPENAHPPPLKYRPYVQRTVICCPPTVSVQRPVSQRLWGDLPLAIFP